MKNIVICCDGTWQNLSQRFPTNVTRFARALSARAAVAAESVPQIVYYDDGVGVGAGVLNEATRLLGGALGRGLDRKIADAYEFLVLNYEPGDRIYIVGFSRGAYTARSLAGLLRQVWILKRENASECERALQIYREHDKDAVETARFRKNHCHPGDPLLGARTLEDGGAQVKAKQLRSHVWIQFLGVWDTVGSLGIPRNLPFAEKLNGKYEFHDTQASRFLANARHAVSIDENRDTFSPTLWSNVDALNLHAQAGDAPYAERPYQQVWFPGGHGAVGGGESDGGISMPPLLWMIEGATRAGLAFDPDQVETFVQASNPTADMRHSDRNFGDVIMDAVGRGARAGPATLDEVSDAARTRWKTRRDYRPETLDKVKGLLDAL